MPEAEPPQFRGVTETRRLFVNDVEERKRHIDKRARNLAREMAIHMSGDLEFTIEDFMFVASLGQPERYTAEMATLEALSELGSGQLVAVIRDDVLQAIGTTAEVPFDMHVDAGGPDKPESRQINRRLFANLNLASSSRRSREDSSIPQSSLTRHADPRQFLVLRCWGEGDHWGDADQFHKSLDIITDPEAIVAFALNGDELNAKILADYMAFLVETRSSSS